MDTTVFSMPRSASPDEFRDTRSTLTSTSAASSVPRLSLHSPSSSIHAGTSRGVDLVQPFYVGGKDYPRELRVVEVTDDLIQVRTSPVPDPVSRTGIHLYPQARRTTSGSSSIGPPPPSPPDSAEHVHADEDAVEEDGEVEDAVLMRSATDVDEPRTPVLPHTPSAYRPVTFEEPDHTHRRQSSSSSQASRQVLKPPSILISQSLQHHPSLEAKSLHSFKTTSASTRPTHSNSSTHQSDRTDDTPFTDDPLPSDTPSQSSTPKHLYHRRNTISSATPVPPPVRPVPLRLNTMHTIQHSYDGSMEPDGEFGELTTDIQQLAEQIRRERLSKRAKAAQEAEQAKARRDQQDTDTVLTRTASLVRAFSNREEGPLVGNIIGEGHVNYVLMYNMLTGIRIAVSRCQAKIRHPLTNEDFTAANKYSFDIIGNELTPSAKYDFKFKDYAPWVFRELREDYFHLDPADYLLSLTAKYILSELGSPGKSGSFFYFSRDYRFIIKTIHHTEHKFLRRILPAYHKHITENPHTLLSRFYGLHRVKLPHGHKIHFVIMNNLFPLHKDIHETYDLKGSTVGREYPPAKALENPRAVLKDLNWINRNRTLELGPEKRALLIEQIRRDSDLLKRLHVMDYSLLIGIHNLVRGNRDNVRGATLKVFSPEVPLLRRKTTLVKGPLSPEVIATRRVVRASDPQTLDITLQTPPSDLGERQHFIFYQDEGGLRATDEANGDLDTIYYLGIIDILTPYNTVKRLEHVWKGMRADRHKISPVPPAEYADRFFAFMKAVMRGGEGGGRFKAE